MNKRAVNRRSRHNKNPADTEFINSTRSGPKQMVNFIQDDLLRSAPTLELTQHPPKNIRNRITWVKFSNDAQQSITTSLSESNYTFQLSDNSSISGLTSYFDQYCIYAVSCTYTPAPTAISSSVTLGRLTTAVDYDNIASLGSETALQAFSSANTTTLAFAEGVQRFIKPCVGPAVYNFNSTLTGYAVGRMWLDCASTSIPHYGIRSIVSGANISYTLILTIAYIVGFRNNN